MNVGDKVKIVKPGHPAFGLEGFVMRVEWLETEDDGQQQVALVAGHHTLEDVLGVDKPYPIYVIRLKWLELTQLFDVASGRKIAQEIAIAVYNDRGFEEFHELVEYPNRMKSITG